MAIINSKIYLAGEAPPYLRVYGFVERFYGTDTVPATYDPQTRVTSKDVVFQPETGVSVRLYLPDLDAGHPKKLPLVIYFHGGGFLINSTAEPTYHKMLNIQAREAKVLLVSVDYRLAPESPIPTLYDDSWAAIKWVASHMSGEKNGTEFWLRNFADFDRVFLAGDSAGANIAHHMAIRAGLKNNDLGKFKISGTLLVHPYFLGKCPIGSEVDDPDGKAMIDRRWLFICPSDQGCDDPLINPFVIGAPSLARLACDKILVCVAGIDYLRERGRLYYRTVVDSEWKGKAEYFETEGKNHVFHILDPTTEDAKEMFSRCAKFFNSE
ncbi:hypothetical protein DH2020_035323 [Rehmannia glutinosa]|uniref:Alpha/beta hydrolase fold-3 domain-containing protein n=1 Tax=Rehmannia glutinosa TaxID=99300 RepID=A0ABR0VA08_REHGL